MVKIVRLQAEEKNLRFHYELAKTLPEDIQGDECLLRQVLLNLLNKAVRFTDEGSVTLSVSEAPLDETIPENGGDLCLQRTIRFQVCDTGVSLTKDEQQRIFQPFV